MRPEHRRALRDNWSGAPTAIRIAVSFVVASFVAGLVLPVFVRPPKSAHHLPTAATAVIIALGIVFGIVVLWFASRALALRRWALLTLWWLSLVGVLGAVVQLALPRYRAVGVIDLVESLGQLIPLSTVRVRALMAAPRVAPYRSLPYHAPPNQSPTYVATVPPALPPAWQRLPSPDALELMRRQGMTVSDIAARYGVDVADVRAKLDWR